MVAIALFWYTNMATVMSRNRFPQMPVPAIHNFKVSHDYVFKEKNRRSRFTNEGHYPSHTKLVTASQVCYIIQNQFVYKVKFILINLGIE